MRALAICWLRISGVSVFGVRGGTFRLTGFCDFSFGGLRRPDESSLSPFTNFSIFARLCWGSGITSISGLSSLGRARFTGLDLTMIISGLGDREGGRGDSSSTVSGEAFRDAVWDGDVEVLDPMSINTGEVRVPVPTPDLERAGEGGTGLTDRPRGLTGHKRGETRGVRGRAGETRGVRGLEGVREGANRGLTGGNLGDTVEWNLPLVVTWLPLVPPPGGADADGSKDFHFLIKFLALVASTLSAAFLRSSLICLPKRVASSSSREI